MEELGAADKGGAQTNSKGEVRKKSGAGPATRGGFRFIDNYGLLVCLGEGGMGEVWAARDPNGPKNLVVAVKTTKQQGAEAARVLWDEARIASLIEHPNVCRVRELGRDGDMQYLVMDYCDGASLHDLLEKSEGRVLPYPLAARILANVCAGLHAAHELTDEEGQYLGVVHRDVSPQNVLISTTGQVTVTDFGVAKALGQAHKATETGEMKGKLSYMAPEQITSREIDRRVDIFALGCVLYQITLGQRPFHGEDALATLYQLLEKDLVRPREINPDYPEELEQIVLRSLAKDRSERFSTAEEMQRALEHFLLSAERPLSESDIASALMDALGDSITARKDEIKRRARALDSGEVFEEHPAQGAAEAAAQTIDTSAGTVTDAPPEPFKKTSWMAAAAVFVTIGLGTIVALKLTGGEEGVSSQNVAAVERDLDAQGEAEKGAVRPDREQKVALGEADAAAAGEDEAGTPEKKSEAKAVPDVTVKVKAFPAGATIKLDGAEVGVGVYRAEIPRSTEGHILELSAPGYDTLTRALVFDRSQDLELSLKRTVVSARPSVQVTPPTKPTSSKTTKKAPRALDSENPFAVPQ